MTRLHWDVVATPAEAYLVSKTVTDRRSACPVHRHDFYEVFYIAAGRCRHQTGAATTVLEPGTVALIRREDAHGFAPADGDSFQWANVAFTESTYVHLRERYFADGGDPWQPTAATPPLYHLTPAQQQWLSGAIDELSALPRSLLALERFLLNLMHAIGALALVAADAALPDWLRVATEGIRAPAQLRGGVSAFVELAGRSPEHVARATRRWLGQSPTELVNAVRLDYAANRLAVTDDKIARIALDCGYESLAHFYRLFARRFELTPRDYRRRNRALPQ